MALPKKKVENVPEDLYSPRTYIGHGPWTGARYPKAPRDGLGHNARHLLPHGHAHYHGLCSVLGTSPAHPLGLALGHLHDIIMLMLLITIATVLGVGMSPGTLLLAPSMLLTLRKLLSW